MGLENFNFKLVEVMDFAEDMHKGQKRKYTGEDYIEHCYAVYELFLEFAEEYDELFTQEEVDAAAAACLLHDTVEDTAATHEDIQQKFGDLIAQYVWYLTKVPVYIGNRQKRKAMDADRLAMAPLIVRVIKYFDLYHNAQSIFEHDAKFTKVFVPETIRLLAAMNVASVGIPSYSEFAKKLIEKNSE